MLMVAPRGSTNFTDRSDTPARSMAHSMVTGSVAEELAVEKAVSKACDIWRMKRKGFFRVKHQ